MIQTKQSKYVSVVLYSPLPVYWHTAKDWCLNMISNGENTARMSLRFNDLTPVWQCSYSVHKFENAREQVAGYI